MNGIIKKPLFVSLFVHLFLFSIVSVSLNPPGYSRHGISLSYLGTSVSPGSYTHAPVHASTNSEGALIPFFGAEEIKALYQAGKGLLQARRKNMLADYYLKPNLARGFTMAKSSYSEKIGQPYFLAQQKTPVFIFHPILPEGFNLYFKDWQSAHVELAYQISMADGSRILPVVKRKISSGNLEVDLLCKRYIANYLFAQRLSSGSSGWQVVKIDLSGKDDQY